MQHLHWGEGRPTPKSATSLFYSWVPGSQGKQNCSTLEPASKLVIENFSRSKAGAQSKLDNTGQYSTTDGLDAHYDVFGDAKKSEKVNGSAYTARIKLPPFFGVSERCRQTDIVQRENRYI